MTPLVFLFVLSFVMAVDNRIIAPLLPSISDSLAATPGAAGLAMTTYAFAYGAGQLVYGPLSDRYGRVAVVRVAALLFAFFLFSGVALGTAVLGRLIDAGFEDLLWALCGGGLALVGLYTAGPRRTLRP